jgi:hypothetical protein
MREHAGNRRTALSQSVAEVAYALRRKGEAPRTGRLAGEVPLYDEPSAALNVHCGQPRDSMSKGERAELRPGVALTINKSL